MIYIYIYDKNIYVFNKYNNQAIKQVIISNYISGPYIHIVSVDFIFYKIFIFYLRRRLSSKPSDQIRSFVGTQELCSEEHQSFRPSRRVVIHSESPSGALNITDTEFRTKKADKTRISSTKG